MGAGIGDFARDAGKRASRGGVRAAKGIAVVEARAGGETVHSFDAYDGTRSQRCDVDRQRHFTGVCAGKHAGQLGRWHGEVCAGGSGPGFSDALHDEWKGRAGFDADRAALRETGTEKESVDAATDERSFCDSAGTARLPRGGLGNAAESRVAAEFFSAHALAREAVRVQHCGERREHAYAAAGELPLSLADELPAGRAACAEGGEEAASGG